jgi:hypothetical protein
MLRKQTTVYIGELLDNAGRISLSQRNVHDIKTPVEIIGNIRAVLFSITLDTAGKQILLEDACILSKETEQ